jgi:hypothetical protein
VGEEIKRRNDIIGKKRVITKMENAIGEHHRNWNSLFPIEQDKDYQWAVAKLERLKNELRELTEGQ